MPLTLSTTNQVTIASSPSETRVYPETAPDLPFNGWECDLLLEDVGEVKALTNVDLSSFEIGTTVALDSVLGTGAPQFKKFFLDANQGRQRVFLFAT